MSRLAPLEDARPSPARAATNLKHFPFDSPASSMCSGLIMSGQRSRCLMH